MIDAIEPKIYDNIERDFKYIGTRPIRPDGVDKVTGCAKFGADLNVPETIYGHIIRSPYAHANIKSIDFSEALKLPGVLAGISAEDFPDIDRATIFGGELTVDIQDVARVVMARHKVLYHGHAVAALAATSVALAEEAAKLVKIEYEVLPHVVNMEEAMLDSAPVLHDDLFTVGLDVNPANPSNVVQHVDIGKGDIEMGFATADVIVERTYSVPMAHQGYIEPHACVAQVNKNGEVEIWDTTQGQFFVRAYTAVITGVEIGKIKVTPSEIGGGFGGKTTVYQEPIAVILAQKTGLPVKMVMSREDVFRATGPTPTVSTKVKVGITKDGKITSMEADILMDAGCYKGAPLLPAMMSVFACYVSENIKIHGVEVVTNRPKVGAYRAPGAPQVILAVECVINELAGEIGMDPIDLRLLNAVDRGDMSHSGMPYKEIGLKTILERAQQLPHYQAKIESNQGRGVAAGFWFNAGLNSSVTINVNDDGTVSVLLGTPDIGGSRASMTLIAAEVLGVSPEFIRSTVVDTDSVGFCDVTGGSRVTMASGWAVVLAVEELIEELRVRAAMLWELDVTQVVWQDGVAIAKCHNKTMTLAELAEKAGVTGGPITKVGTLTVKEAAPAFSVNICDVEVDKETGKVIVLRYTCIQDVGKAIHPSYVEGQMQGGAVQGIGWALNEEYIFTEDGVLDNAGFLDYRIPVSSDLPMLDTVIVEVPNKNHPLGIRGVGEVPICPPMPAVVTAVNSAAGIRVTDLPLSPTKLLAKIDQTY